MRVRRVALSTSKRRVGAGGVPRPTWRQPGEGYGRAGTGTLAQLVLCVYPYDTSCPGARREEIWTEYRGLSTFILYWQCYNV